MSTHTKCSKHNHKSWNFKLLQAPIEDRIARINILSPLFGKAWRIPPREEVRIFTMFGTIRYDRESQHAEFIDRTESVLGDAATEHAACDKCRLTKLRCTGQRSGCDRCRVRGIQCVYSAAGSRDSRKARKNTGSGDLKVRKPREKTKEKPREKPKRQRKPPGSKKPGNVKSKTAVPADQQRWESVNLKDEVEMSKAVQPASQTSRTEGYHPKTIQPKIERGLEQSPDRPVQHGVLGVIASWPQPHQLGLDLPMATSPYDGLPDMALDPGFLPTSLVDTSNYTVVGTDASPDDDNFAFFTSDSPFTAESRSPDSSSADTRFSSETTSPMFTNAPSSPTTADADIDMRYSVENDDPMSCRCIGLISGIMDDLDDLLQPVPSSSILSMSTMLFNTHSSLVPTTDSMLASLKTQISNATRVIHCTLCQSRTEHVSLLIRACEMIVRLAERVALCYPTQTPPLHATNPFGHYPKDSTSTPPPTPAPSPPDILPTVNPANINLENAHSMRNPTEDGSLNATSVMFFGRYKTDPSEYETLMRVLIVLQLKALAGLLGSILRQGSERHEHQQQKQRLESCTEDRSVGVKLNERQIARAQAAQGVVGSLIARLEGTPQGFLTCA